MFDLDSRLIFEKYKLISEIPASLEFMGDDPEIIDKLDPKYTPVVKSPTTKRGTMYKSKKSDINAWASEKAKELMKSTVQQGTAKGLDKRRQAQGKPPLIWRLVDANLESESSYEKDLKHIIHKSALTDLVNNNPSIENKFKSPNGITVIMTPSGQDDRSGMMAFSAWIRSHKCAHAILENRENIDIDNNITNVLKLYYDYFKESLNLVTSNINLEEYPILNSIFKHTDNLYEVKKYYNNDDNFYQNLFTFGSARNKKLIITDMKEELVAQLMQTGKITINKMLDDKTIKLFNDSWFDHLTRDQMDNPLIKRIQHVQPHLLNIEEYIADQIDHAIENCIGKILFDVVL